MRFSYQNILGGGRGIRETRKRMIWKLESLSIEAPLGDLEDCSIIGDFRDSSIWVHFLGTRGGDVSEYRGNPKLQ